MTTDPIYMTDPYLKELQTKVSKVFNGDNFAVILEQTILYPMGGGQPTDQGILVKDAEEFEVYQVMLKDGEILNYIKGENINLNEGDNVRIVLNWERRLKNMKIHTAGHIIDFALARLGYIPSKLTPQKADHGKKPFIEYAGILDADIQNELQLEVDKLVAENLNFSWEFLPFEQLKSKALYLQPNLPTNKPLRSLTLEGVGTVADGGTILKTTSEVGKINIEKIENSGGKISIYYSVETNIHETNKKDKETIVELSSEFQEILDSVKQESSKLNTEDELTNLWRKYLGKEGEIKSLMNKIKDVPAEERKEYGSQVNTLRSQIDLLINSAKEDISKNKDEKYLQTKQDTLSYKKAKIGHYHPLTETINEVNEIMRRIGYSIYDGPELETDEYLFQRLNLPMDHPARDLQDSIYVEEPNILMRTQTSSIEARALENLEPPFKVVMPGRVYRNEKVTKTNHFTFHQYQLVCVQQKVSMKDLISTIDYIFKSYLGEDAVVRYRNKYYPEVEPGLGLDLQCPFCHGEACEVCKYRGWIEMGGAGIIHPNVITMAGLDKNKWQGYAFGLGLDRWAMAKHNIKDIRTLLGGNLAYKPFVR